MEKFNFYQLTDLHLYAAQELGSHGKYFEEKCKYEQMCVAESRAIVDEVFKAVENDKDNELVFITGDLTKDGEIESHKIIHEKINALQKSGKRVFVTFATHDFDNDYLIAYRYDENGEHKLPMLSREQLRELYGDCGWQEAVSEHVPSYSYAVRAVEGFRFLLLNDDGDGKEFCGYYDDLLAWIENQVREADSCGERIIAFTHHPMLPPSIIYPIISHRDMLGNYETVSKQFADWGIEYVFTGHTHAQSIEYIDTEKGNRLYHINTGTAVGCTGAFRKVSVTDLGLDVRSCYIEDFKREKTELSVGEYMKAQFTFMTNAIFTTMADDIEAFKELAKSFSMEPETVERFKPVIQFLGKVVNNITFGQIGKLLLVNRFVDKSIENKKIKDFVLDLVFTMFSGRKLYPPKSPEYKATMAAMKKLGRVIKLKDHQGKVVPLESIAEDLLYDTGDYDNTNAFLPY